MTRMEDFYKEMKKAYLLQVEEYKNDKGYVSGLCGLFHETCQSLKVEDSEFDSIESLVESDIRGNYRMIYKESLDLWLWQGYLRHSQGEHIELEHHELTDYYIAPILDFDFRIELLDRLIIQYREKLCI